MDTKEYLILVDENDQPVGKAEKLETHQAGLLHRAFSIFILNTKGELLLQQRADDKYHSAGLWTNTCCSHPRYGEELHDAVKRRLKEEMGLSTSTSFVFSFVYKTIFENGLIENEFDHVFLGVSDEKPSPDENEVKDWKYMDMKQLEKELDETPQSYSSWLKICFSKVFAHLENKLKRTA